jgi:uncharacterized OB-fold protein
MSEFPDHSDKLKGLVGEPIGRPRLSPHAVNAPMIRHWVEAMGDVDPVYESDEAARAVGLERAIAPPTMLQAWIMRGLRDTQITEEARQRGTLKGDSPNDLMMALLDEEGMTSVVATNCDQTYDRPLVIGDRLLSAGVIEAISDVKTTGLGVGRFITNRIDFVAVPDDTTSPPSDEAALFASGERVATMRFRMLKFRPKVQPKPAAERPLRPRPAITQDNAFFFEGAQNQQLLIQRCIKCQLLRHPPLPACSNCGSFEWDTVVSSGKGALYSFVVVHYPQVPAFDYPLPLGLIELEEGTRLVANLRVDDPAELEIGQAMTAHFEVFDDGLTLPVFSPDQVGSH